MARLCQILDPDVDDNNELNCPQIISHSSYHDSKKYLQHCKHLKISSRFLGRTYSPLMLKLTN